MNAYGQTDRPCPRCGTGIMREQFMNRSSHYCPNCQRLRGHPARFQGTGAQSRRSRAGER
ncbi:zinc finger domain-containing protein [Luteococcus sp.]|uniref:zinc finger domain-containing protein n=1 Tax=Luteococcus sp. TaxID=1969402 RepID=UPI003736CAA5